MASREACGSYQSAASLRRELAQIIEASTEAILASVYQAVRRLRSKAPHDEAATGAEFADAGRQVVGALPGLLRGREGAGCVNGGDRVVVRRPGVAAGLSAPLRHRLHTLLGQAVWDESANHAPEDWSPTVAARLQHDLRLALAQALGGTADECVEELAEDLRRRRQEHMDFCAGMLREHEEQRDGLAGHMHDVVAQALAAARYHANVAQRVLPGDTAAAAREALEAQRLIEHALAQIRRLLMELRPPALDRFGLRAAINDYTARLRQDDGVDVTFHGNGDMPQLCPVTQSVLYRVLQDAFRDLLLPLGATAASVRLHVQDDAANLIIEQEGEPDADGEEGRVKTLAAKQVRSQLARLQARAELVGGTVEGRVGAGRPARIEIRVPVENGGT